MYRSRKILVREQRILGELEKLVRTHDFMQVRLVAPHELQSSGRPSSAVRLLIDLGDLEMPVRSGVKKFSLAGGRCLCIPAGVNFTFSSCVGGRGLLYEFSRNNVYLTLIEGGRGQSLNYELAPRVKLHRDLSQLNSMLTESLVSEDEMSLCQRSHLVKVILAQAYSCRDLTREDYTGDRDRRNFYNMSSYLADNHTRTVRQKELAEVMGLTVQHLNRISHKITGMSLHNYINAEKMEYLRRLLELEALKNVELARRTGFNDVNYMGQAFKKHYGMTPHRFKNMRISASSSYDELCAYHWTKGFEILPPCDEVRNSDDESKALYLYLYNGLDEQLDCFWRNKKGEELSLFKLLPQRRIGVFSNTGQTFIMRSKEGELICAYRTEYQQGLMLVHRDFDRRKKMR